MTGKQYTPLKDRENKQGRMSKRINQLIWLSVIVSIGIIGALLATGWLIFGSIK